MFFACESLTSITIPDSATSIGNCAFQVCTALTSIIISNKVEIIGYGAFYGCTDLTDIYYTGTEEEWAAITVSPENEALSTATIHYNYIPEE